MFSISFVRFGDNFNFVNEVIEKFGLEGTVKGLVYVGGVLLCMIIAYLLGSLNFGIILSKFLFHEDIRNSGSGNAGSTNMLRTYGKKAAALTLVLDMLKGAVAVVLGSLILGTDHPIDGAAIAGLFVVIGHMFPCFFGFKGGKGVATTGMVMLITRPLIFLIALAVFLIIVIGTKYVSLGSVIAVMLYPILLYRLDVYKIDGSEAVGGNGWNVLCAILIMLLVVFMHRGNIKRLMEGKESKISFGKGSKEKDKQTK